MNLPILGASFKWSHAILSSQSVSGLFSQHNVFNVHPMSLYIYVCVYIYMCVCVCVYIYIDIILFILTALDLYCCAGFSLAVVCRLLSALAFLLHVGLSSCSSRALKHRLNSCDAQA